MAKGKFEEWLLPEGLIQLEGWARDGLTDEQIAFNIGIKRQTLYDWKKRFPDISDTLKKGKEVIDRQVENALLRRAIGYQYDEVTKEADKVIDEESGQLKTVMVETKRVTKEVQPDVTARIFWLKNRRPDKWRDKQDVQHSGSVEVNNPMKDLTTDELRKLIRDI
ncbi:hypothetical protein D3C74_185470 [compost metagenome]